MAIAPKDVYPGQTITSDPGYPQGKARNDIVEGDGVGTPLEQAWVNDLYGFQQGLLDAAGLSPSGTPDEVGASQYVDAITKLHTTRSKRLQYFTLLHNLSADALAADLLLDVAYHAKGSGVDAARLIAVGSNGGTKGLASRVGDRWDALTGLAMTTPRSVAARQTDTTAVTWVVVGDSGAIETSTDGGSIWTARTSALGVTSLTRVRWGNGLFVCLGGDRLQTSPDGVTWTERANPTTAALNDAHYADGIWVVVGDGGTVLTSLNGITWTDRTAGSAVVGDLLAIVHDAQNDAWIAAGAVAVQSSPDGVAWTDRTAAFGLTGTQEISAIGYDADGTVLATRRASPGTAEDLDGVGITFDGGVTWDVREYDYGVPSGAFNGALFVEGRWVLVGISGSEALVALSARI